MKTIHMKTPSPSDIAKNTPSSASDWSCFLIVTLPLLHLKVDDAAVFCAVYWTRKESYGKGELSF